MSFNGPQINGKKEWILHNLIKWCEILKYGLRFHDGCLWETSYTADSVVIFFIAWMAMNVHTPFTKVPFNNAWIWIQSQIRKISMSTSVKICKNFRIYINRGTKNQSVKPWVKKPFYNVGRFSLNSYFPMLIVCLYIPLLYCSRWKSLLSTAKRRKWVFDLVNLYENGFFSFPTSSGDPLQSYISCMALRLPIGCRAVGGRFLYKHFIYIAYFI